MDRRELAGDKGHRFRCLAGGCQCVEHRVGHRVARVRPERPGRKCHLILGERRYAKGVVHQHLVVALRNPHRRQDGTCGIWPHQQVHFVRGHQLLVHGARQIGLGLVVLHDPLDFAPEQAATCVELFHIDFTDQFVRQCRGRQRPGQGQCAAYANRWRRLRVDGQWQHAPNAKDCRQGGQHVFQQLHEVSPVIKIQNQNRKPQSRTYGRKTACCRLPRKAQAGSQTRPDNTACPSRDHQAPFLAAGL